MSDTFLTIQLEENEQTEQVKRGKRQTRLDHNKGKTTNRISTL